MVLEASIRRVTCQRLAVPVLCGSSLKNKGIEALLDAIVLYLPSPKDRSLTMLVSDVQSVSAIDICSVLFFAAQIHLRNF